MDSQERHELKENDLERFLTHFGEWWSQYGVSTLAIIAAIAAVFAGYQLINKWRVEAHENAWAELALQTSPESYRRVAESYSDPVVQSLAYLRGGDLFLEKALAPTGSGESGAAEPDADAADGPAANPPAGAASSGTPLDDAAWMYEQAIAASDHRVYRLNAMLGLAAVAESRRDWQGARERYEQVIREAGDEFPAIAAQAERRLGLLESVSRPIVLSDAPAEARRDDPVGATTTTVVTGNAGDESAPDPADASAETPTDPEAGSSSDTEPATN